jgi:hypothetical protein
MFHVWKKFLADPFIGTFTFTNVRRLLLPDLV